MKFSKVYVVNKVSLEILKSNPPQLRITADGLATSGGWSGPELVPYVYIQPPPDGIYEFDFIAVPPDGPASQSLTEITANSIQETIPDGFRGVRIYASQNHVESLLSENSLPGLTLCLKGVLTDEGVECQAMRSISDELYTLVGNLEGFAVGDEVYVTGTLAQFSFCQQGQTVSVTWIGKEPPKC